MRIADFHVQLGRAESWPSWVPSSQRRRADPLCKIASAAIDGLLRNTESTVDPSTALVVSTSYGAIDATWRFCSSLLAFGDHNASPTPFTNSVHNSIAGNIGESLHIHGPCTTLSQGQQGTCAALRWARLILHAQRAPAVLVVLGDCHNQWSESVIGNLIHHKQAVGDGAVALLCYADDAGPGRVLRDDPAAPEAIQLDAGSIDATDECLLVTWSGKRSQAAQIVKTWWPSATLAQLNTTLWQSSVSLRIAEAEDGRLETLHLGPWHAG